MPRIHNPLAPVPDGVEEHPHQNFVIRLEFYVLAEGEYVVSPYIEGSRGGSLVEKRFPLQAQFKTKDEARAAALEAGRKLIAAGL